MVYRCLVDVTVYDLKELRSYALNRALSCGMTQEEFERNEDNMEDGSDPEYWLGWCFDAGTPEGAGFDINESSVEWCYELAD